MYATLEERETRSLSQSSGEGDEGTDETGGAEDDAGSTVLGLDVANINGDGVGGGQDALGEVGGALGGDGGPESLLVLEEHRGRHT